MDAIDVNMKCRIIFPPSPENTQFTYRVPPWGQALVGIRHTKMAASLLQGGLSVEGTTGTEVQPTVRRARQMTSLPGLLTRKRTTSQVGKVSFQEKAEI